MSVRVCVCACNRLTGQQDLQLCCSASCVLPAAHMTLMEATKCSSTGLYNVPPPPHSPLVPQSGARPPEAVAINLQRQSDNESVSFRFGQTRRQGTSV